jgi:hypothetical protein
VLDVALQRIINGDGWFLQVLHQVVDTPLHPIRNVVHVSLRDWFHDRVVGGDIRLEDCPVYRLRRVVFGIVGDRRIVLRRGASATAQ